MKPFNLNEYIKDPSKKVITRNGKNVRIVCTDRNYYQTYPVIGLISYVYVDGKDSERKVAERIVSYTANGEVSESSVRDEDLFFASEKKEGWISIFKTESGRIITSNCVDETEELSRGRTIPFAGAVRIAVVKIEWEE